MITSPKPDALMLTVKVFDDDRPDELAARTVKVKVPALSGMPVIEPSELSTSPEGRSPLASEIAAVVSPESVIFAS